MELIGALIISSLYTSSAVSGVSELSEGELTVLNRGSKGNASMFSATRILNFIVFYNLNVVGHLLQLNLRFQMQSVSYRSISLVRYFTSLSVLFIKLKIDIRIDFKSAIFPHCTFRQLVMH